MGSDCLKVAGFKVSLCISPKAVFLASFAVFYLFFNAQMLMALCGNLRQVSNAKYSVHAHPELSGIYHFKTDVIVYLVCRAADPLSPIAKFLE